MNSYFDTVKGSENIEIIARSLVRIANALEENNHLMEKALTLANLVSELLRSPAPQRRLLKKSFEKKSALHCVGWTFPLFQRL